MLSASARLSYLSISLWKRLRRAGLTCPNCGSREFSVQDRKYLITELRRCHNCRLLYRAPAETDAENERFYQDSYQERIATDLPTADQLTQLIERKFRVPGYDYSYYISVLTALRLERGSRVFDFGCSWGYGSWQLREAGFDVKAFEISRPRAAFARGKLGIEVLERPPEPESTETLAGAFDCFFSSHVAEHVPRPAALVELAQRLVRPGGFFVAFTPNGSEDFRRLQPRVWHRLWGKVHPNMIDPEFWRTALAGRASFFGSSPVDLDAVKAFAAQGLEPPKLPLDRAELICIARL